MTFRQLRTLFTRFRDLRRLAPPEVMWQSHLAAYDQDGGYWTVQVFERLRGASLPWLLLLFLLPLR
jgi:hypothetical protein